MDSVRFAVDADAYGRYWDAVHELDPNALDESRLAGGHEGHLTELLTEAGLRKVEELALPVFVEHATFEDWWGPFTLGVGPAGMYLKSLERNRQAELRERCQEALGAGRSRSIPACGPRWGTPSRRPARPRAMAPRRDARAGQYIVQGWSG